MVFFRMHTTLFVFLKCTIEGWPKVDVLLFLQSWLIFWDGSDKEILDRFGKKIILLSSLLYSQKCNQPGLGYSVAEIG